jgi:hypothetical protein
MAPFYLLMCLECGKFLGYILWLVIERVAGVLCAPRIIKVEGISREFAVRDDLCWGMTAGIVGVVSVFGVFKLLRALYLLYR